MEQQSTLPAEALKALVSAGLSLLDKVYAKHKRGRKVLATELHLAMRTSLDKANELGSTALGGPYVALRRDERKLLSKHIGEIAEKHGDDLEGILEQCKKYLKSEIPDQARKSFITTAKDLGIADSWEWVTYGSKTCQTCKDLSGKVFKTSKEYRPAHIGCMCDVRLVIK